MSKTFFSNSAKGVNKIAGLYKPSTIKSHGWLWRIGLAVGTYFAIVIILMLLWSREPSSISAEDAILKYVDASQLNADAPTENLKTGVATTAMTLHLIDTLTNKTGGYIRNDVTPPGIFMDNMPEWEYGVLRNLRDLSTVYRDNFSMSGSQTTRNQDLADVENKLRIKSEQWIMPRPESYFQDAHKALKNYLTRIVDNNTSDAQFYARADNLRSFLNKVSPSLGSYSQRLSESVGTKTEDMALAGDAAAEQTTAAPEQLFNKTPWLKIDNNFYEARGYAWALLQEMRAIEVDFSSVLEKKNATVYVKQLIRELEATQSIVWSPVILNGSGFGVVTNHSLVMASYLSRADVIITQLSDLLERG